MSGKLGELLIEANLVTKDELEEALALQIARGGRLGTQLIEAGYLDEHRVTQTLSQQLGVPGVNLEKIKLDPSLKNLFSKDVARKYQVLPVHREAATLTLAMTDPSNRFAMDDIKFLTGYNVEPVVSCETALFRKLDALYGSPAKVNNSQPATKVGDQSDWEPVNRGNPEPASGVEQSREAATFLDGLLTHAQQLGASDIHLETRARGFRVRYRINGVLGAYKSPPSSMADPVIRQVLQWAKLDGADGSRPLSGTFNRPLVLDGSQVQMRYRMSYLPGNPGCRMVLHPLHRSAPEKDLARLGMESESRAQLENALGSGGGLVVVTGPVRSGKTTTVYALLQSLNEPSKNVLTVESEIEYPLAGVHQVQLKQDSGLGYGAFLRSFLQQDPDILMVGEINNLETAELVIRASLKGYLVLAGVPGGETTDPLAFLTRLGIPANLLAAALSCVVAQRLVGRICEACKMPAPASQKELLAAGFSADEASQVEIMAGKGCSHCSGMGIKGRIGLYEVMKITDDMKKLIAKGADARRIKKAAVKGGMITLKRSGLKKVFAGITSLQEVVRETVI